MVLSGQRFVYTPEMAKRVQEEINFEYAECLADVSVNILRPLFLRNCSVILLPARHRCDADSWGGQCRRGRPIPHLFLSPTLGLSVLPPQPPGARSLGFCSSLLTLSGALLVQGFTTEECESEWTFYDDSGRQFKPLLSPTPEQRDRINQNIVSRDYARCVAEVRHGPAVAPFLSIPYHFAPASLHPLSFLLCH